MEEKKKNAKLLISKTDKYDHCVANFTENWHHDMATFWSQEHPDAKLDEIKEEFCAIAHLETHESLEEKKKCLDKEFKKAAKHV